MTNSMIYRIQELREAGYTWRQCDLEIFQTNTNDKCFKIAQKYKIAAFSISNKPTQPRVNYKRAAAAPETPTVTGRGYTMADLGL